MVKIVTGKINSGKTTRMMQLYEADQLGDGFVSIKEMFDNKVKSYSIKKLSSEESKLFIIREEFNTTKEKISFQIGPYQIIQSTLLYVEEEIKKMIMNKVTPIYLDEVGLLELEDKAFAQILKELVASELDLVLSIREDLIEKITKKYKIKNYTILN